MFGKSKTEAKLETVIGSDTHFQGEIKSKNAIRIDGRFEGGSIEANEIIIGENASVNGDLTAQAVIIGGKVTGNINAVKNLEIQKTAQVFGDIRTQKLSIEEGAVYEGHCTMLVEEKEEVRGIRR